MDYTWQITGIKKLDTETLDGVIVQTYWKKIGTDENGNTGTFVGATPFDLKNVNPNNFVSYKDLTEEMIINWIKSVVVGSYEVHVNSQIAKEIKSKINPVVEVNQDFPWSNGD